MDIKVVSKILLNDELSKQNTTIYVIYDNISLIFASINVNEIKQKLFKLLTNNNYKSDKIVLKKGNNINNLNKYIYLNKNMFFTGKINKCAIYDNKNHWKEIRIDLTDFIKNYKKAIKKIKIKINMLDNKKLRRLSCDVNIKSEQINSVFQKEIIKLNKKLFFQFSNFPID